MSAAGWGWLDRRIGAHLALPAADGPIRGRAGLAYAAALLCAPQRPASFRSVAAAVGMSPTAISNAVQRLTEVGLVGAGNEPMVPELFWTLAEVWGPTRAVAVRQLPDRGATGDDLEGPGWVLGGDQAATELGAPVVARGGRRCLAVRPAPSSSCLRPSAAYSVLWPRSPPRACPPWPSSVAPG